MRGVWGGRLRLDLLWGARGARGLGGAGLKKGTDCERKRTCKASLFRAGPQRQVAVTKKAHRATHRKRCMGPKLAVLHVLAICMWWITLGPLNTLPESCF